MEILRKYLENIYIKDKTHLKNEIENYLYLNYNGYYHKVVCDNTNNFNGDFIIADIHIKKPSELHYTTNRISIVKNKARELRYLRNEKLKSLYDTR